MFSRSQQEPCPRANAGETARPLLPERLPEQIELLSARCPAAGHLLARARLREPLGPGETHALIQIFTHLGEDGRRFVHQALAAQPGYDPDEVNRALRAVPPTPIGCRKVRRMLLEDGVTDLCRCVFRLPAGTYPAPLVHLDLFPKAGGKLCEPRNPPPDLDGDGREYGYLSRQAKSPCSSRGSARSRSSRRRPDPR
ncbi:MAG: hypothetical protein HY814_02030 [Candidatus Riflebacteria bacterium]|nr:hypothetical protein [Candidatus Riflebacteria bacterium]